MSDYQNFLIEYEVPRDIRVQMPKRFTRFWKLARRPSPRIMWDALVNDLVIYNPENVDFTNDEFVALLTLGSKLKREAGER